MTLNEMAALKQFYDRKTSENTANLKALESKIQMIQANPDFAVNRMKYYADLQDAYTERQVIISTQQVMDKQHAAVLAEYNALMAKQQTVQASTVPQVEAKNVIVDTKAIALLSPTSAAMVTKQAVDTLTKYPTQTVDEKLTNTMLPVDGRIRVPIKKAAVVAESATLPVEAKTEAQAIKSLEEKTSKMNLAILGTGIAALVYILGG